MQKQSEEENIVENISNLFIIKKENIAIKYRMIMDIKILFELQGEYFLKHLRAGNIWNNNYIKYGSNIDRNKKSIRKRTP